MRQSTTNPEQQKRLRDIGLRPGFYTLSDLLDIMPKSIDGSRITGEVHPYKWQMWYDMDSEEANESEESELCHMGYVCKNNILNHDMPCDEFFTIAPDPIEAAVRIIEWLVAYGYELNKR